MLSHTVLLVVSNDALIRVVVKGDLSSTGRNRYFVLEPGFQLVLEGKEGGKTTVLTITVLNDTKMVDGVETRVVE